MLYIFMNVAAFPLLSDTHVLVQSVAAHGTPIMNMAYVPAIAAATNPPNMLPRRYHLSYSFCMRCCAAVEPPHAGIIDPANIRNAVSANTRKFAKYRATGHHTRRVVVFFIVANTSPHVAHFLSFGCSVVFLVCSCEATTYLQHSRHIGGQPHNGNNSSSAPHLLHFECMFAT
jgi:hypothetical protein